MKILNMQQFSDGTILSTAKHFVWYKPQTWLPVIIRYFTKGFVGHSAVIINIDGISMVAESKVPQVTVQTFSSWYKGGMDVYVTRPDLSIPTDFREKVLKKIGSAKYDYRLLFFTQPLYILTGLWIAPKQGKSGEPFTCSEFVAYTLGVQEPWKETPMSLVSRYNNWEIV